MAVTREDLVRDFNLGEDDVRETLRACGLSLKKRNYSDQDVERFAEARRLFNEGAAQSYDDIAAYFKGKETLPNSESDIDLGDDSSLAEHIRSLEEEAIRAGFDLGLRQAEIMGQVIPQAAIMRLKEMIASGELRQNFQQIWQQAIQQGKSLSVTEMVEARWRQYQLTKYQPPTSLPESSTESSGSEF